jgi:hypothetical protein
VSERLRVTTAGQQITSAASVLLTEASLLARFFTHSRVAKGGDDDRTSLRQRARAPLSLNALIRL